MPAAACPPARSRADGLAVALVTVAVTVTLVVFVAVNVVRRRAPS
ncbi:MAG: hypothetical protein M5U28_08675 [Sandaracinaceae bacterium]|nr:hypothetical protein [Sandaracinaceae bacterium]